MEILRSQSGSKTVLALKGRLDTVTAPQLQSVLLPIFDESPQAEVELDFKGLEYVSSAGLRVLLLGEKTAKGKGGVMSLSGVGEEVREVFEMTGFSDILKIV
jgi:anti-anti-sigma factor